MEKQLLLAAKAHFVSLMTSGHTWQQAAQLARLSISRTAAYRLTQAVRLKGEVALQDGRKGHPHKLLPPIQDWIIEQCQLDPHVTSATLQVGLLQHFALPVSISRLNRLRASLKLNRVPRNSKKTHLLL